MSDEQESTLFSVQKMTPQIQMLQVNPFSEIQSTINMARVNPFSEIQSTINMARVNPFSEIQSAINMARANPFSEIQSAINMARANPFSEMQSSINAALANPFNEMQNTINQIRQLQDPFKILRHSLQQAQNIEGIKDSLNLTEPFLRGVIASLDGKQSMNLLEEVSQLVEEYDLSEAFSEHDRTPVNIISEWELKTRCYKFMMALIIILMSSTLELKEIEKITVYIFAFIGALSSVKTLTDRPKSTVENHYHITISKDSNVEEIVKKKNGEI
jgi:hypothetical protein